jgi:tetraacyldisaccharide 4'-kinase
MSDRATHVDGAPMGQATVLVNAARTAAEAGVTIASMTARAALARRLESNLPPALPARLLASVWSFVSARQIARPLVLAPGVRAIGVGGASLGGSCKTPFAIALVEALAARGSEVALVGHAYRARPGHARVVHSDDDVAEVGDDALFAARRLAASQVDVIVGPSRQSAATFAARRARWLVFDGLLQARPERLAASLLLLDGAPPWHHGDCPPAGDRRAPLPALLRAADATIVVGDATGQGDVVSQLDRARFADGSAVPLSELRGAAVGLVLCIARPHRVVEGLARRGLYPVATLAFPDHHRPTPSELARATARTTHRIEAWLTTGKCATKLPPVLGGAPVLTLEHALRLSDRLIDWVASLPSSPRRGPW